MILDYDTHTHQKGAVLSLWDKVGSELKMEICA
jgi:hypothetical protein